MIRRASGAAASVIRAPSSNAAKRLESGALKAGSGITVSPIQNHGKSFMSGAPAK